MRVPLIVILLALGTVYANSTQCISCHPREVHAFETSAMGRSVGEPMLRPEGVVQHPLSGSTIEIRKRNGALRHELTVDRLSAHFDVAYEIGAGKVGFSFLVRNGNYLFQSPVSWYTAAHKWDLTPGYESEKLLDFDHPILSGCLFCHTGTSHLILGTVNQYQDGPLEPISCERCHGSAEAHLRNPVQGSIINPAKLPRAARDSVCEQCHLEGVTRILKPAKNWWDYRVGEPLENYFVTYVNERPHKDVPAVTHSEQLAESKCARSSGGKLWCGTCHDPHGERNVRDVCLSCHAPLFASQRHKPQAECTTCHMPKVRATDVSHAAVTDHRLPARPSKAKPSALANNPATPLRVWREPAHDAWQQRDLGLAYYESGATRHAASVLNQAYEILRPLARSHFEDADVEAAVCGILIEAGQAAAAIPYLEAAVQATPRDPRLHTLLGAALNTTGQRTQAIRELELAIECDPSSLPAYQVLADLYTGAARRQVLKRYLTFMPQSVREREALAK